LAVEYTNPSTQTVHVCADEDDEEVAYVRQLGISGRQSTESVVAINPALHV
jgi:hypothetical protein